MLCLYFNSPFIASRFVVIAVQRAVLSEDGTLSAVSEGTATLSTDARAVEEKTAAEFLKEFSKCISNPENMLM